MFSGDRTEIINFRLSPTEANAVAYKIACLFDPSLDPDISSKDFHRFVTSYLTLNINGMPFYLLPMCKDARSPDNEPQLDYIGDRIENLSEKIPPKGYIISLLAMCRGYFKLPITVPYAKRHHASFSIADLNKECLDIYDSQGRLRKLIYPDQFADKSGKFSLGKFQFHYNPSKNYHAFGKQEKYYFWQDVVSCVYYALYYLEHFLKTGSMDGCENIKLNITKKFKNKWEFLNQYGINISCSPLLETDAEDINDFVDLEFLSDEESQGVFPFDLLNYHEQKSLSSFKLFPAEFDKSKKTQIEVSKETDRNLIL